ncbi:hypothetical protein LPJ78_002108 [Coemansia sp. RSA 989]|nr:hypothetical protein LPJ68_002631 [Coemansia sp. RSA 1086]KAJ1751581.1 hypothetical protein LPJ79_001955 [Coemansia sp. RSA 1821]KAJ1866109.1 hypothetical protein LPJ78_002108 [Coemansia sp. RSA 989]KAJ1875991.1 hypothetical protein LPJ55_000171 [Coemansia sp. RSA 990]KAJ2674108.1 hypothetical protein IWW42_001928 [Coemansia sp. RSA 1085]
MAYSAAPDPALDCPSTAPFAAAGSLSHSHSQLQLHLPPASASLQYAATAPLLGTRLFANEGVSSSPAMAQLGVQSFAAAPVQLWMGDIEPWMDEECIRQIWAHVGESVSVKMIRDRLTGGPANYCFIELPVHTDAERFLALYNGKPMPLPLDRPFRLNWASGVPGSSAFTSSLSGIPGYSGQFPVLADGAASSAANGDADTAEYSLFVGDLAPEVTDVQLVQEFRCRYASVRAAKVVMDSATMLPRGYGFVRFSDEADRQRALVEMQGHLIGSRAIRVSTATPKRTPTMGSSHSHHHRASDAAAGRESARSPAPSESSADSTESYNPATDPFNTTVFVGGLVNPVGEDELHKFFAVYGEVVYCKIPPNRGCGFVTFAKRTNAETAMRALNGHMLGGSRVRLSWGRSQSHARHNYRNHHRHNSSRHHHQNCHSSNGGASGANSHRNSVSEHHPLYPRRSVSFGKSPASAAPTAVQPATLGLGLGLSGAPVPGAAPSGSTLGMQQPQPQHGLVSLDTANIQPSSALLGGSSFLGSGLPLGHHPQQPQPMAEHMASHSAFYTIASGHPGAVPGIEALGSAAVTPLMGQTLGYYYQQPQPQQSALPAHNAPGDLLTRRLSTLNLNSGSSAVTSVRNSTSDIQPPSLDRRASAGVIGQRRLSTKPSFSQASAAQPQKAVSQLSLSQLWPQTPALGDYCSNGPLSQLNDYHGALSTPASSARLSTSSLSLLALPTAGNDSTAETSARPSMEEQPRRRDQQLEFELGGAV